MSGFSHRKRYPDTTEAARRILPHVFEVGGRFESAVDVGGGLGAWAAVLKDLGVARVFCLDDPALCRGDLLVQPSEFLACDISQSFPAPVHADLALCLEVAEHLPEQRGDALIRFLTDCAEVVLFSAAIPGQPSPYHVNEQPPEFWRERFAARGYLRFDCLRPRIICDETLPYWYRQNLYLFATTNEATKRHLRSIPFLKVPPDFELVSTRVLWQHRGPRQPTLRDIPRIAARSLRARLNR